MSTIQIALGVAIGILITASYIAWRDSRETKYLASRNESWVWKLFALDMSIFGLLAAWLFFITWPHHKELSLVIPALFVLAFIASFSTRRRKIQKMRSQPQTK